MSTIRNWIKRHAVLSYYAVTFAISWGGILLVIGGPAGIPGTSEQIESLMPFVVLVMLSGPPVTGILLTGLVSGRAGFREVFSKLLRWRVGARWYAVALLTAPLVFTTVPLALSFASPDFLPVLFATDDKASLLLSGIMTAIVGGFMEELGWTGFAIPRLRLRHGVIATGLSVGVLWGAWHLLATTYWPSTFYLGGIPLTLFLTLRTFDLLLGGLPAYRLLMVWVYDRTGSLLIAMLMHASLIACNIVILPPVAGTGPVLVTWLIVSSAALWIVVGVFALADHWQLQRNRLQNLAA